MLKEKDQKPTQVDVRCLPKLTKNMDVANFFVLFERILRSYNTAKDDYLRYLQAQIEDPDMLGQQQPENVNCDSFKDQLLSQLILTEEDRRIQFRQMHKLPTESYQQYLAKLRLKFALWKSAANVSTIEQMENLIIKEALNLAFPKDIFVWIANANLPNLQLIAQKADTLTATRGSITQFGNKLGENNQQYGKEKERYKYPTEGAQMPKMIEVKREIKSEQKSWPGEWKEKAVWT